MEELVPENDDNGKRKTDLIERLNIKFLASDMQDLNQTEIVTEEYFDFKEWNNGIITFNIACSQSDASTIVDVLQRLTYMINNLDDLTPDCLMVLEKTEFFENAKNCLFSSNEQVINAVLNFVGRISFCSCDFVKIIAYNGFINMISKAFHDQIDQASFNLLTVNAFLFIFAMLCFDSPMCRYIMVQQKIVSICEQFISPLIPLNVINSALYCVEGLFAYAYCEDLPVPNLSMLFSQMQLLLASALDSDSDFSKSIPFNERAALSCYIISLFNAFSHSNSAASIILQTTVPRYLYAILTPLIETDLKPNIIYPLLSALMIVFNFAPKILLKPLVEIVNIECLLIYIDSERIENTINVLYIIETAFCLDRNKVEVARKANLFTSLIEMEVEAIFSLKKAIIGVISSAIVNGTRSTVAECFLNFDVIEILIDSFDLDISCSKNIPGALLRLCQLVDQDSDLYSMILPYVSNLTLTQPQDE